MVLVLVPLLVPLLVLVLQSARWKLPPLFPPPCGKRFGACMKGSQIR